MNHDPNRKDQGIDECRATSSSWAFMSSSCRKRRSFMGFGQEPRFWTRKNKSSPILKFRPPPKQNHRDLLLFEVCSLSFVRLGLGLAKSPSKYPTVFGTVEMSLRRWLGYSDGDLMRADAKPCSRLMRQTATIFTVGGGLGFWILCRLHYGPRITVPRSLRWVTCGAVTMSSTCALLVRLFSPECEPQNIAAYDKGKPK